MGVDVARGGSDQTVTSKRYDNWFDELHKIPGRETPDGAAGVGSSAYDQLAYHEVDGEYLDVYGVNNAAATKTRDRSGMLPMRNIRAASYWGLREALDPDSGDDIALPDDPELLADLCAPRWKLTTSGVQVESKEEIVKRLNRSPDCGDAVVLAHYGSWGRWD
jgi:hypothetical protein